MRLALAWRNPPKQARWQPHIVLSKWAPCVSGQLRTGPWPAPKQAPSAMQKFWMRPTPVTALEVQDLSQRMQHLPLMQALRARGVTLPALPLPDSDGLHHNMASAGMLDLAQVPQLRHGLWLLGVLAVLGAALLFEPMRWRFVAVPWSLHIGGGVLCALLCGWLVWPRTVKRQVGLSAAATAAQARHAACVLALLCGALLIWAGAHGLLWWSAHAQTPQTMVFVLDKSSIDPGPVRLQPEGEGPSIEWDSMLRFWQSEPEGQRYSIPVFRSVIGPWWLFDDTPVRKRSEAFYRKQTLSAVRARISANGYRCPMFNPRLAA